MESSVFLLQNHLPVRCHPPPPPPDHEGLCFLTALMCSRAVTLKLQSILMGKSEKASTGLFIHSVTSFPGV